AASGDEPFYARSFAIDPLGTAEMLLTWRDGLIEAGWAGTGVPGGGARLEAFAAVEAMAEPVMLPGPADRLAAVEVELAVLEVAPYAELVFVDERRMWPHRWRRIFDLLAERGTAIRRMDRAWHGAPGASDLGRLQACLRGEGRRTRGPVATAERDGTDAAERTPAPAAGEVRGDEAQQEGGVEAHQTPETAAGEVRGDGSLVLLRAATSLEAAAAVAAMVGEARRHEIVIVRAANEGVLDEALAAQGQPTLGRQAASPWRAALQVLPLAVDLVFEPCDPRRVLDLLGLPVSPFSLDARFMLSRALCDAPGIGDVRWQQAKERLRERLATRAVTDDEAAGGSTTRSPPVDGTIAVGAATSAASMAWEDGGEPPANTGAVEAENGAAPVESEGSAAVEAAEAAEPAGTEAAMSSAGGAAADKAGAARAERELELIEAWLECARHDAHLGAPRDEVVAAAWRVREWARRRMASGGTAIDAVAFSQCEQLLALLAEDGRERLDRLTVRQLLDAVTAAGAVATVSQEQAGRADHVDHADALLADRDTVVWWQFTADTAKPPHRARWRKAELEALAACGVRPTDPAASLAEETRSWRTAALAATGRLVLVVPDTDRGERMTPHPLWDELVARLRLDDVAIARLTVSAAELLTPVPNGRAARMGLELETEALAPLPLPPARPAWHVAPGSIAPPARWTPGSIQELLECPLRWVLGQAAGIGGYSVPALRAGPWLNGRLGHRLVEVLLQTGGVARSRDEILGVLDGLLPGAAAWLLQPGMAFELEQLRHQLATGVDALARLLEAGALTIAAIEEEVAAHWLGAEVGGRLDVRLQDRDGRDVILDLKWGHGSYRELLQQGRAVQLAVYAHARRARTGAASTPPAAYFSLGRGRVLATDAAPFAEGAGLHVVDGPSIERTIERIAATVPVVQRTLAAGQVPVTGLLRSPPLLDALGVASDERERHYVPPDAAADLARGRQPAGCTYCRFGPICGQAWEAGE
ncbi:MAG TPA: PD-(D/E)XK nuclease family protein, partial [Kofleriaceae bacterium]|nr:PD-(D/E)XK nuclease family protein [Kofleriaceae bacterium]